MSIPFSEYIRISGTARTRDEAINEVADILIESGAVSPMYRDAMFARESSVSTYMGNLLAIPHGTNEAKDEIFSSALAIVRYDHAIDWDGNEVRFVIGIAGRDDSHMDALASIAMIFSNMSAVNSLLEANTVQQIENIFALERAV